MQIDERSFYDTEEIDVITLPIVKSVIRIDPITGTLLDFAMIEVNGAYFHVKAILENSMVVQRIDTNVHTTTSNGVAVIRRLDNTVDYEEIVSSLPIDELGKLQRILSLYTTLQLVVNVQLDFTVFVGCFYSRYQTVAY